MRPLSIPDKSLSDFYNGRVAWDTIHSAAAILTNNDPCGVVDLSNVLHVKPYVVAIIAAMAKRNQLLRISTDYVAPTNHQANEHLCRLGLPELIGADASIAAARRSTNLPIRVIQGQPDGSFGWETAELLEKELGRDLPAGTRPGVADCIDEIVGNAAAHSESAIGCVVVGQAFPSTGRLEATILDLGITIRGHLSRRSQYAHVREDGAAIELAMQDAVTGVEGRDRFGDPHSGAGLARLEQFLSSSGGSVAILSGSAVVCTDGRQPKRTHCLQGPPFQGTLVNISFAT